MWLSCEYGNTLSNFQPCYLYPRYWTFLWHSNKNIFSGTLYTLKVSSHAISGLYWIQCECSHCCSCGNSAASKYVFEPILCGSRKGKVKHSCVCITLPLPQPHNKKSCCSCCTVWMELKIGYISLLWNGKVVFLSLSSDKIVCESIETIHPMAKVLNFVSGC